MANPVEPRRGLAIALIVAAIGVGLAYAIDISGGWVERYRSTLISAVWLYLPLPFLLWGKKSPSDYGISWGNGLRGLLETLAMSTAVLIPFYAAFFIFYPMKWGIQALPGNIISQAFAQFLVVALPEEFFFRGFLQSELEGSRKRKWKILGAELGLGWIAASFIFALGHLALLATPIRAAVVFPALLFGWVRARTKSVLYPAIMHTLFNLTFLIAQRMVGL